MAEAWWQDYDNAIGKICPDYQQGLDALVRGIPANAKNILEVGAGTGNLTTMIAQALPNSRIIGIDKDASMLEKAKGKVKPYSNITLVNQATEDIDYNGIDTVVSSLVFHMMPRDARKKCFRECIMQE